MIRVLIAGYHGFGNCGDEAILQAMTANIRAMAHDLLSPKKHVDKTYYAKVKGKISLINMLYVFKFKSSLWYNLGIV